MNRNEKFQKLLGKYYKPNQVKLFGVLSILIMNYGQLIYLISLALQISGAIILIIFCWGNTEHRVLNTIYPANSSLHREDDNTVIISKEKLFKAHKTVLLNRNSFVFIALGYLISLFGSAKGVNPWEGLVIVIVASVVFIVVGVLVSHLRAKMRNRRDRVYEYEDLCSKLDNDVSSNYIKSEVVENFKV